MVNRLVMNMNMNMNRLTPQLARSNNNNNNNKSMPAANLIPQKLAPTVRMFSAPNPTRNYAQLDFGKGVGCNCTTGRPR